MPNHLQTKPQKCKHFKLEALIKFTILHPNPHLCYGFAIFRPCSGVIVTSYNKYSSESLKKIYMKKFAFSIAKYKKFKGIFPFGNGDGEDMYNVYKGKVSVCIY